jgi:hypothetical protein
MVLANIQALGLVQRGTKTDTSVGTRRRPQALVMTLLQALRLANLQTLGLTQRDTETDTYVRVGTRRLPQALDYPTGIETGKHTGTGTGAQRFRD